MVSIFNPIPVKAAAIDSIALDNALLSETESQESLLVDDLAQLSYDIDQFLLKRDRGDDTGKCLEKIKRQIKGLAIDLGFTKEVFANYDACLKQQGLVTMLAPLNPQQQAHVDAGLDPEDLQHLEEQPRHLPPRTTARLADGRLLSID